MIGAVVAVALAAQLARVAMDDRVHLVVIRDDAAAACPSNDELARRVRARIGSEPFRDPVVDGAGRELRVGISADGDALKAKIALFSKEGDRLGRRQLSGPADCRALADDLVLAVAIAIDPLLLVRRRPTAPVEEPVAPAVVVEEAPPEEAPPAPEEIDGGASRRPVAGVAAEIPGPASIQARAIVSVAAGVGVVLQPSVRAEASLDYGVLDIDLGARLDVPARYPISDEALIDMTLLAADLSPCLGWSFDITYVRGCGVLEAGALAAQGVNLEAARAVTSPWVALGTRAGVDVWLWPTLGVAVVGDLSAPLIRPRFVDDTSGEVYAQPAPIVGTLGVGLELQIR